MRRKPGKVEASTHLGRMGTRLNKCGLLRGFLFLLLWGMNRRDKDTPRQRLLMLIGAIYFGAASGLLDTFRSRLWRWPLPMVSAIVIVSYLVVAFVFRQEVATNWSRDWNVGGATAKALASQIPVSSLIRWKAQLHLFADQHGLVLSILGCELPLNVLPAKVEFVSS